MYSGLSLGKGPSAAGTMFFAPRRVSVSPMNEASPAAKGPALTSKYTRVPRTDGGSDCAADIEPLILCLPGSRRGEVSRLLPIFRAALTRVVAAHPGARIVIPTTPNVTGLVRSLTEGWAGVLVLDPTQAPADAYARQKRAAFRAADVALAASGTVSLELAAAGTPMVIAYRMNALSQAIITRLLRVDTVTLVNLVSESRTVPEFIGRDCRPEPIAAAVDSILGAGRPAQIAAMDLTMERLGRGGEAPGLRAARSVLAAIGAD